MASTSSPAFVVSGAIALAVVAAVQSSLRVRVRPARRGRTERARHRGKSPSRPMADARQRACREGLVFDSGEPEAEPSTRQSFPMCARSRVGAQGIAVTGDTVLLCLARSGVGRRERGGWISALDLADERRWPVEAFRSAVRQWRSASPGRAFESRSTSCGHVGDANRGRREPRGITRGRQRQILRLA